MKILINYSDNSFVNEQRFNSKTGKKNGFDKVLEYKKNDLNKVFLEEFSDILNIKQGGGLWIWKSEIILDALEKTSDGDFLFYSDSGLYFINNIDILVDFFNNNKLNILFFHTPLIESQWTSKSVFDYIGIDYSLYGYTNQIIGGYFLFKNNNYSKTFFKEFDQLCKKTELILPNPLVREDSNFIEGRHDQSILSLLVKKYGIKSYEDISHYGDKKFMIEYIKISSRLNKNLILKINKDNYIHKKPILVLYRRGKLYKPLNRIIFLITYNLRKFTSIYIWRMKWKV